MEKDILELERALSILATEINRINFMLKEVKDGIASRNLSNYREHPAKGTNLKPGVTTRHLRPVPTVTTIGPTDSSTHD
jgi:hypothetical protein